MLQPFFQVTQPADVPTRRHAALTQAQMAVLNRLRRAAMGARVAARTDLFAASAALKLVGATATCGYMETFVRCLPDAMGRPVTWFVPGASEVSDDEAWAMRCLDRIAAGDEASLRFLLHTRIRAADRRNIGFLLGQIVDQRTQP